MKKSPKASPSVFALQTFPPFLSLCKLMSVHNLKHRHITKEAVEKEMCKQLISNIDMIRLTLITRFFISNTFIISTRVKLAENQANAKQNPNPELQLFENYSNRLAQRDKVFQLESECFLFKLRRISAGYMDPNLLRGSRG